MTENSNVIRVMIADDHTIFRDGLKFLLAAQPDFQVVAEACDGEEALQLVRKARPDVLLLDLQMPKLSGLDVLRELAGDPGNIRTILLSGVVESDEISKAFELGARGVVLKDSTSAILFKSIHAVMEGQYWIGRQAVSSLVQTLKRSRESTKTARKKNYGLTAREMQIMEAIVSGYSNTEIAGKLSISEHTVKHHITSIFDKLGVYNRLELTLFAFHHELVEK
jgi:two-component system, NarL family, nitrate/nitrite response regulator NarL